MIAIDTIPLDKAVYCFELDDVLYPRQDYVLQVYYLFAQFVEFTEGSLPANDLALFMKDTYLRHGEEQLFTRVQERFGLAPTYEENLNRLLANAHLPLKLLLFAEIERFLQALFEKEKKIAILTKGNPVEQLNKIKHIAWGALEAHKEALRVYFVDELKYRGYDPIDYVAKEFNVPIAEIYVVS